MGNKTIFEWAEMLQEQIQNGASQSDIIQILEDYKNQALRIHNVVGRSEQLPCGDCENYAQWDNGIRWCSVCGTKLS